MNLKESEIAWLAGILEGEGYFAYINNGKNRNQARYSIPKIVVAMNDQDVIERVALMFATTAHAIPQLPPRNTTYRASITGKTAIEWMLVLYPYMGNRRRERIRWIIAQENSRPMKRQSRPRPDPQGFTLASDLPVLDEGHYSLTGRDMVTGRYSYPIPDYNDEE